MTVNTLVTAVQIKLMIYDILKVYDIPQKLKKLICNLSPGKVPEKDKIVVPDFSGP